MSQASSRGQLESECPRPRRRWRDLEAFNRERFRAEIARLKVDIEAKSNDAASGWARVANGHIRYAEQFCRVGEIDAAWSALKAASRQLLETYDQTELGLEADRVRREAGEKLDSWRKAVVEDILSSDWGNPRDARSSPTGSRAASQAVGKRDESLARVQTPSATGEDMADRDQDAEVLRKRVRMARAILDDDADNVHRRLRLLSGQLLEATIWLAVLLPAAVVVIFLCSRWGWEPSSARPLLADPKSVVVVMTLGAIGGATSGLFTLLYPGARLRIPDVKAQRYLIRLRPIIGGAAALIVVAILRSGIGGVEMAPQASLGAALIAGFSERTITRAVAAASAEIAK